MAQHRAPAEVLPPGEFLKDELEARGWTQTDLAEILGRPTRLVNEIVLSKRAISPETAHGLANALGTTPEFWMNLESAYQLSRLRPEDLDVQRRAKIYSAVPIKELVRRGWVEAAENPAVLEQRVLEFMGMASLDAQPEFRAAARTSLATYTIDQCAWLARARQIAGLVQVTGEFTRERLAGALTQLKSLLKSADEIRRVPEILSAAGIRIIIVEPLPKTEIDGVCLWLGPKDPVVVLSLRADRLDGFWFTLMHELAHVHAGDGKVGGVHLDINLIGEAAQKAEEKSEIEKAADAFAARFLLPTDEIRSFVARVRPLYSKEKILGFANRLGVHPGLVVGRLQFMKEINYSHSREMLPKVRDQLSRIALTDGWGNAVSV
jgi:HTH-type transcriptional regulator/antitoxin HigA